MPSRPAPRPPEPDRPDAEPEEPPRSRFRHLSPVDDATGEETRHGHGSGCIPIILIRFSLLGLLIWLALTVTALLLTRHPGHPASGASSQAAARP